MTQRDLSYQELVDSGWDVEWFPVVPPHNIHRLELTLRDEAGQAVVTVVGDGRTPEIAITDAVKGANAYLQRREIGML